MADGGSVTGTRASATRWLLVNSIVIFTIAFLVTALVHEGAHALTARAFGTDPVLHHNYVAHAETESSSAAIAIPASGPLISLLQGIVLLALSRRRKTKSLYTLTGLWLGLQGYITFLGYVMIGPLVPYGDTGKVFALLGVPGWLQWILAAGALVLAFRIVRGTAVDFERHAVATTGDLRHARARVANQLIAFPVFAGVVLTTLLSLPSPTPISLIHPLTSPFVVFLAYGRIRRSTDELPPGAAYREGVSWPLVGVLALLVVVSRLLVPGVRL